MHPPPGNHPYTTPTCDVRASGRSVQGMRMAFQPPQDAFLIQVESDETPGGGEFAMPAGSRNFVWAV